MSRQNILGNVLCCSGWRLGQLHDDDGGLDADGCDDVLPPAQLHAEQQSGGEATW